MSAELVDRLLLALKGSRATELEYEAAGIRVRITRSGRGDDEAAAAPLLAPLATDQDAAELRTDSLHVVRAGLHGTFFRGSAPEQPPLAEVGQQVQAGQPVALIEAMKMLHAVECERAGRVVEVLAVNGSTVEPGSPLLVIDTTDTPHV
jgi:biotin carboxyl carrier protein